MWLKSAIARKKKPFRNHLPKFIMNPLGNVFDINHK